MRDVNVNRPRRNLQKLRRSISKNRTSNKINTQVQKYHQKKIAEKESNGEIIDENNNNTEEEQQQTPEEILKSRSAKHNKHKHVAGLKNIDLDQVKVDQLDRRGRRELKKLKVKQEKKQRKALYRQDRDNQIDME